MKTSDPAPPWMIGIIATILMVFMIAVVAAIGKPTAVIAPPTLPVATSNRPECATTLPLPREGRGMRYVVINDGETGAWLDTEQGTVLGWSVTFSSPIYQSYVCIRPQKEIP